MSQAININEKQISALQNILKKGKIIADGFDKRTVRALELRGLVKTSANKKGFFVQPTAKGKKFLN